MTNPNDYAIIVSLMRSWRNWQTRKTKDLVGNSMQVQFLSTAPNKRAPLAGAFLFGMFLSIRQELRVGAVLREQNALPRDICTTNYSMAKPDVSNVGAGRAAKGAFLSTAPPTT